VFQFRVSLLVCCSVVLLEKTRSLGRGSTFSKAFLPKLVAPSRCVIITARNRVLFLEERTRKESHSTTKCILWHYRRHQMESKQSGVSLKVLGQVRQVFLPFGWSKFVYMKQLMLFQPVVIMLKCKCCCLQFWWLHVNISIVIICCFSTITIYHNDDDEQNDEQMIILITEWQRWVWWFIICIYIYLMVNNLIKITTIFNLNMFRQCCCHHQ